MASGSGSDRPRSEGLLDITGVAERLGVSVRHIRRLVAERRIPYLKWGHLLRFDPADIDAWLQAARVPVVLSPDAPRRASASDRRSGRRIAERR